MDNRFHRTELLIGPEAVDKLKNSHVAVFGMGGVGSYAVEGLARAGVGHLTIMDFDSVGISNINRQNIALSETVGLPKVDVMEARIRSINPECKITKIHDFFCEDNCDQILNHDYHAVVDAIDSFNPKITLIVETLKRKIPLFAAMGAAGKIDPSMIRMGDVSKSNICPLARRVRKSLRSYGISSGFKVVYSIEPPILPFSPYEIEEEKQEVSLNRGRPRMVQGSISYLTALFGLSLSGMVVQELTGYFTARESPQADIPR